MDRRLRRSWLALCIVFVALLSTRFAVAAPNDAAAQKLRDQAIDQDYLATDFAAAEKKLTDALNLCKKTSDCSPFIRARLHCDLGVVEFMMKKLDLARTEFATALIEDPSVGLDTNLSNTDVQREFAAVKAGGAPPPAGAAPGDTSTPGPGAAPAPDTSGVPSAGGISHVPPPRQAVRTPLPLYVEVPDDIGAAKVVVRYRAVGARDWKATPMHSIDRGFGVEVPCTDVGNNEGDFEYYIQALDANGDLVAASGRNVAPHKVAIVKKLEGEPPHFPNQSPPHACAVGAAAAASAPIEATSKPEASDCPPGFPGCRSEGPTSCDTNDDCSGSEVCEDHLCQRTDVESKVYKRHWLSLAVQVEDLILSGAGDACAGGQGFSCFQSSTGQYYPAAPALGRDDKVLGGFATTPMVRILVGYDRVVLSHVTIGARLGYAVVGGGPQRPANGTNAAGPNFLPLHIEGRVAYWFGRNAFARRGLRLYALLSGGVTEVDASQSIDLFATSSSRTSIPVDAWTKSGLGFGAAGLGLMYAITPNMGVLLEGKGELLFPTFGSALAGQLGFTVGL